MYRVVEERAPAEMALALVQREYPEYHPLIALARLAHKKDVTCDPRLELAVHQAILPYVQPKLSSVEVKAEISDLRRVVVTLFEDIDVEDGRVVAEVPLITNQSELVPLDQE
jgi:hypothetical protein